MSVLLIIFVAAAVILVVVVVRLMREVNSLTMKLRRAESYFIRGGVNMDEVDVLLQQNDWIHHATGGNTNAGRMANFGMCPCQSQYTVASNVVFINAWPNPGQVAACAANPPLAAAPEVPCPDDCVQVMTHIWRGWDVFLNVKTEQLKFHCYTFAQYHCKKPDDPARFFPPKETDPGAPET